MERTKLRAARVRRGWTLEQAAEYVGVGRNTLWRWEHNKAHPYPYHVYKLCEVYALTVEDLDLQAEGEQRVLSPFPEVLDEAEQESAVDHFGALFRQDLELRLQYLIYDWLHRTHASRTVSGLQNRLSQELKDNDHMHEHNLHHQEETDLARRDALRRLALLPIQALGLSSLATAPAWAPEAILTHCAAGVTACGKLSTGLYDDMTLALAALSTYLPPLKKIVEESSFHRQDAARLVAQALFIKATLSVHREGPQQAASQMRQALIYGKESHDVSLHLMLLQRLSWMYACAKQRKQALETMLEAQYLLEHSSRPIPSIIQCAVYGGTAKYQALNGQQEEAFMALRSAHATFFAPQEVSDETVSLPHDHNQADLLKEDGETHYYLGQHGAALTALAQAIDPETLTCKVPVSSERVRIEILNLQTLASLKHPRKEMELSLKLWTEGMQGAIALRSEQRFLEALTAYDIMEALWPDEKRIIALKEYTRHW